MRKIIIVEKENEEVDRHYWMSKSPEDRLSTVEFLREQFYVIQGFVSVPRLTKKIRIVEGFD